MAPKLSQPQNASIVAPVDREDSKKAASSSVKAPKATQDTSKASSSHAAQAQVPLPTLLVTDAQAGLADSRAKEPRPATESGVEEDPNLSQKFWSDAYDFLEEDKDTKELEDYLNTLAEVLVDENFKELKAKKATDTSAAGAGDISAELKNLMANILDELKHPEAKKASDISAAGAGQGDVSVSAKRKILKAKMLGELKDRTKRQMHMKILAEKGRMKAAKASKITKAVGDFAQATLLLKLVIDPVIQYKPQAAPAALPWAGVCIGLQVSSYPSISWCPYPLISPRSCQIPQSRRDPTLQASLTSLPEWTGIAP
jgi:hypothetical protein